MERDRRPAVVTLWAHERPVAGRPLQLADDECQHARVRRLGVGSTVRLVDGAGTEATGTLVRLSRHQGTVDVESAHTVPPLPPVHLLLPVADRDHMLTLAEKAAELGVTSWRPVLWKRSRSVSPRGEGMTFQGKVRARMIGALKQSGGTWLPELHPAAAPDAALAAAPEGTRIALEAGSPPMTGVPMPAPIVLAIGPEGGLEPDELESLKGAGFTLAALGPTVLRFETAAIVALGFARTALTSAVEMHRG